MKYTDMKDAANKMAIELTLRTLVSTKDLDSASAHGRSTVSTMVKLGFAYKEGNDILMDVTVKDIVYRCFCVEIQGVFVLLFALTNNNECFVPEVLYTSNKETVLPVCSSRPLTLLEKQTMEQFNPGVVCVDGQAN